MIDSKAVVSEKSKVARTAKIGPFSVIGPNVGGFKELLLNGGGFTYEQLNFEDLVVAMNKSLMMNFDKERKKIMNINKKYNPSEISLKFANKLL